MPVNPETIQELITRVIAANPGWTKSSIARRAGLTRSRIGQVSDEGIDRLDATQVRKLAHGLNVAPETVIRAALAGMGVPLPDRAATPEEAIRLDPDLSLANKASLLVLLKEYRRKPRKESDLSGRDTASMNGEDGPPVERASDDEKDD